MNRPIIDDIRIEKMRNIITPIELIDSLPVTDEIARQVFNARKSIENILYGSDNRLLIVVGPCSIHDTDAAMEYGQRLSALAKELQSHLFIVMRVYFEKPRTTVGWKGLINDPNLDGSFAINDGLKIARDLLVKLNQIGLPCATEFLDIISPQYVADLISWGAIGARTTESQIHRELASGLSAPIGFKNGTDGNIKVAADAIRSASQKHHFLSITKKGVIAASATRGNKACHIILRGGNRGQNYTASEVQKAVDILAQSGLPPRLMIDCSHANSNKDYRQQARVANDIGTQLEAGDVRIIGAMLESHLIEGNQEINSNQKLEYGQSITDACIGWEETETVLRQLSQSVQKRQQFLRSLE